MVRFWDVFNNLKQVNDSINNLTEEKQQIEQDIENLIKNTTFYTIKCNKAYSLYAILRNEGYGLFIGQSTAKVATPTYDKLIFDEKNAMYTKTTVLDPKMSANYSCILEKISSDNILNAYKNGKLKIYKIVHDPRNYITENNPVICFKISE